MTAEQMAIEVVGLISEKLPCGLLPPFPSIIVAAVLEAVPGVREATEAELQVFADLLHVAILDFLEAQDAAEGCQRPN